MTSTRGSPYTTNATALNFEEQEGGISNEPTLSFATPNDIYLQLDETHELTVNSVKGFFYSRPSCLFWHNGNTDSSSCTFHGLHLHAVIHCTSKLSELYKYRMLKKKLNGLGVSVRCQKVQRLEALLAHLQQEPRVFLGCNNMTLCACLKKTKAGTLDSHMISNLIKMNTTKWHKWASTVVSSL